MSIQEIQVADHVACWGCWHPLRVGDTAWTETPMDPETCQMVWCRACVRVRLKMQRELWVMSSWPQGMILKAFTSAWARERADIAAVANERETAKKGETMTDEYKEQLDALQADVTLIKQWLEAIIENTHRTDGRISDNVKATMNMVGILLGAKTLEADLATAMRNSLNDLMVPPQKEEDRESFMQHFRKKLKKCMERFTRGSNDGASENSSGDQ